MPLLTARQVCETASRKWNGGGGGRVSSLVLAGYDLPRFGGNWILRIGCLDWPYQTLRIKRIQGLDRLADSLQIHLLCIIIELALFKSILERDECLSAPQRSHRKESPVLIQLHRFGPK
jgi:hypothetical protein